jgi:hypothetical protein
MESSSFAIWNRNKMIAAIAAGIWGTNAAIMIMGKSLPLSLMNPNKHDLISGVVRVNNILQFNSLALSYPTTDSRCMGACGKHLRNYQHRVEQTFCDQLVCHRHYSSTHHARWLATHSLSRWRFS